MNVTGGAAVHAEGLVVRIPGQALPVLSGVGVELHPGEVVGVCGRSGCGKSTLLHAVAGLVPWARTAEVGGRILVADEDVTDLDPGQRAHLLATCLDRPDAQLFLGTVRQELEAARRLHGETPSGASVAQALGLPPLLDRRVTELSSGERQRVALAVALAAAPRPVLLDEPTVHLDEAGAAALVRVLGEVREMGGSVLLAEQAGFRLGEAVNRWLQLEGGNLRPCRAPAPPTLVRPASTPRETVLEANDIRLVRGGQTLLEHATLTVSTGEVVLLSGPNGSGKSSLARALAGHAAAASGGLAVTAGRIRRPRGTALVLAEAGVQLFADSVAGELALAGVDPPTTAGILRRHRLDHLGGRAPWMLSRGERQRLVHAAIDALQPAVTIIDEPGQGLDPENLVELAELMARRAEGGRGYLIISQRMELAAFAHRHLVITNGTVVEAGGSR